MSKMCSCGAHFELQVQLVMHCRQSGHAPWQQPAPRPMAAAPRRSRIDWRRQLLVGFAVLSLAGVSAAMSATVQRFTSWHGTANVLVMP